MSAASGRASLLAASASSAYVAAKSIGAQQHTLARVWIRTRVDIPLLGRRADEHRAGSGTRGAQSQQLARTEVDPPVC